MTLTERAELGRIMEDLAGRTMAACCALPPVLKHLAATVRARVPNSLGEKLAALVEKDIWQPYYILNTSDPTINTHRKVVDRLSRVITSYKAERDILVSLAVDAYDPSKRPEYIKWKALDHDLTEALALCRHVRGLEDLKV